jgi:hypothetical protein
MTRTIALGNSEPGIRLQPSKGATISQIRYVPSDAMILHVFSGLSEVAAVMARRVGGPKLASRRESAEAWEI